VNKEPNVLLQENKWKIDEKNWIEQTWGKEASEILLDIDSVPEPDWMVEGIVVRQGLTLIYGDSGVGKTTFCLHLIDALQKGSNFFGRKCKRSNVLLVEQDQNPPILKSQKMKLGRPDKLAIVKDPILWDNKSKKFTDNLNGKILRLCPDVVIIDAYTSLGIEDINHPGAGLAFDALRRYSKEFDCAFVILHHTNKSGDQMGSMLNIVKMDSVIQMSKKKEKDSQGIVEIFVKQQKVKGDAYDNIELMFDTRTLRMFMKENTKQAVYRLMDEGRTLEQILVDLADKEKPETIRRYYRGRKDENN
jgi:predicted ATP-dependent serine protease